MEDLKNVRALIAGRVAVYDKAIKVCEGLKKAVIEWDGKTYNKRFTDYVKSNVCPLFYSSITSCAYLDFEMGLTLDERYTRLPDGKGDYCYNSSFCLLHRPTTPNDYYKEGGTLSEGKRINAQEINKWLDNTIENAKKAIESLKGQSKNLESLLEVRKRLISEIEEHNKNCSSISDFARLRIEANYY